MFLHRSLRQKKTCSQGQDKWLRKLRHPCKQRWHTPCCAPLTPLSLRLVLAKGVPARFFFQAFAQSSPAATLAPKPSKVSLRSISLHWVQPPLIVRLACGSRGRRAVIVFACYVSFLLLPPSFHRCGSIAPLTATSFQPKGEFVCAPSFRSVLSVTLQSLHYIHSLRQTLLRTPQKKLHSTQKLRQHSWGSHRTHFAYATFRALCLPPSLNSHRLRLTLRRQVKHSAIATPLSHRLRCSRLLSLRCFPLYLPRTIIPVDIKNDRFFSSSLNLNTDSKCLQLFFLT